jgi:hypothetical protein
MAGMGQEERFPPTRLNAGYGFRKETIAGMRRNGRDAPIPRLPGFASLRGSDGSIHKKAHERPCCTDGAHRRGDAKPRLGYEIRT